MKALFTFACLLTVTMAAAQSLSIDSLNNELFHSSQDSSKVKVLRELTLYYENYKPDSSVYYARQMIKLSQKLQDKYHEAAGFNESALALTYLGNYPEGLQMALNGKKVAEQLYQEGKPERLIFAHLALGILDRSSGRYADAVANFQKSIRMTTLKGYNAKGSKERYYGFYSQLAAAYVGLEKLDSALFYAKKAYELSLKSTNKARLPVVFTVLANVYEKLGDYISSHKYYHLAIAEALRTNQVYQLTRSYNDLAVLFKKQGLKDSCIFYAKKSIGLSQTYNYAIYAANGYDLLAQMYELQNKRDSTLKYLKLMLIQKDTLFSQAKVTQYQMLIFNEEQRQQQAKEEELNKINRIKIYALIGIVIVCFITAAILYGINRQKQKANVRLQVQQARTQQALQELKSTQAQLIQSEKMASLGELTAGIAHEIQNPLNFVNNFSEVSSELVQDLCQEEGKEVPDKSLVKDLLTDLEQNLSKIHHHGKRADSIVKGMLEHSRASAGEKQLTDINALAEEYLRLAYHGLRAKDKDFNANLLTDFDTHLGKQEVVPQEVGRVLLNLFNNAFYATQQKKAQLNGQYQPEVKVSTQVIENKLEIRVHDNGTGIPNHIQSKIFQPFFTTKPTGQGTGLGLSLSYDIVKAHGGEMNVTSFEGQSATFTISLPI